MLLKFFVQRMSAKPTIVITSIFAPTEAVEKFAGLSEYQLVVAGDKKSPAQWSIPNVTYLSVADQEAQGFNLSSKLPYNHYGRKMMGYLHAMQQLDVSGIRWGV